MSSYTYPTMAPAGSATSIPGFTFLSVAPQADILHVDLRVLRALNEVGRKLGRTLTIFSGYRSPDYSASVGGYATDPHTRGVAADVNVGATALGDFPGASVWLSRFGLESGAQPNFYKGGRDPAHVQIPGSGVNKALHAQYTLATGDAGAAPPLPAAPAQDNTGPSPAAAAASGCAVVAFSGVVTIGGVIAVGISNWMGWL